MTEREEGRDGSSGAGCPRCEQLPDGVPEGGILYLAPPSNHIASKLNDALDGAGLPWESVEGEVLSLRLGEEGLRPVSEALGGELTTPEREEVRAVVLPADREPSLAELLRAESWSTLAEREGSEWLIGVLSEGRLETHFQPIVDAADPLRVHGHECLLRGRTPEGEIISPGRLFGAAREADLLFQLDREARTTAIREAARLEVAGHIFINFNPVSIYDPAFCLRTTVGAADAVGMAPERVVFEVVESDDVGDPDHLHDIVDYYRNAGFRVALDDLGKGYGSLTLLERLRPDVVKLDMELIRDVDQDAYKSEIAGHIVEMARRLGIETVAEGVERRGEWEWARDRGVDYVSGFLFARPARPPAEPRLPPEE